MLSYLLSFASARRLKASPNVHHAEHLAALRKVVMSDPLGLLKSSSKVSLSETQSEIQNFSNLEGVTDVNTDDSLSTGKVTGKASKFLA